MHIPLPQLRRITSSGRFVPEIDGLRFVAILSVVLYHFHGFALVNQPAPGSNDSIGLFVQHGYRGVNLFYVISGFILGLPFAAHYLKGQARVSLKSYYLRRLTRLEPPYILNLLVCFAVLAVAGGATARGLLPHLGASLFYAHSLWFGEQSAINPVAWTLEVEVQFYCLAPLLAAVFRLPSKGFRRLLLGGLIVAAGMVQVFYWDAPARARLSILFAIQFFLCGLLLADLYTASWNERPARHWRWDLVSAACWPAIFLPPDRALWPFLPLLLLAACVAAFRGVLFNALYRNGIVTIIGGMCYTLYLFHYQLIPPMLRFGRRLDPGGGFERFFALQFLIYAAAALAFGCAYFVLVERPCMAKDWPRRIFARRAVAASMRQI